MIAWQPDAGRGTLRRMAPPALWLYRALMAVSLPVMAPFLLVADRRRGKKRPPWSQRLGWNLPAIPAGGVWVQAVSVGEVAVARPLLAELRRRHPGVPLVLSATTATGLAMASGAQLADVTLPFPVDLPGPVRRLMDAARPRLVVLVETELWPELLAACGARGIPVVLVNARVSDKSFRGYRAVRSLLRPLLAPVSLALAQDEQSARRLAVDGRRRGPRRGDRQRQVRRDAAGCCAEGAGGTPSTRWWAAGVRGRLHDAGRGGGRARRPPETARRRLARSSCWRRATRNAPRRWRSWRPTVASRWPAARFSPRRRPGARSSCSTRSASLRLSTSSRTSLSSAVRWSRPAATTRSSRRASACP